MVAETKEGMKRVFDAMSEGFRTSVDTGRKAQEAWFGAFGNVCKNQTGVDTLIPERFTKDVAPFVAKNAETVVDCMDKSVKTGADAFNAACETVFADKGDFYSKTRTVWDTSFDAMRTNMDTIGRAGKTMIDNWTSFCRTTCSEASPKGSGKPAK